MTSLSSQLSHLQSIQSAARTLDKNSTFSLLFDFKTAASFPIDTIYSLAYSGFQALLHKSPSFSRFSHRFFFSPAFDRPIIRENMLAEENNELHKELEDLILMISPYFLTEEGKKVLEFLIKAYEVHRYEAETLLVCFLGYHKTLEYTKLAQNVNLKQLPQWEWMEQVVKTGGNTVDRMMIVKIMEENAGLLDVLVRTDLKIETLIGISQKGLFSLKEKKLQQKTYIEDQVFHSFLVALIFDALKNSRKLRENKVFITGLLNYIGDLAKGEEKIASSMMLFCEIIERKVNVNRKIIGSFAGEVIKKAKNSGNKETLNKIIDFIIYLSQRNLISEELITEIIGLLQEKHELLSNYFNETKYDLKKLFLLVFEGSLQGEPAKFPIIKETLLIIMRNAQNPILKASFLKEIAQKFLEKLLLSKNHLLFVYLYKDFIGNVVSNELLQLIYQKISANNSEEHDILVHFLKELNETGLLPLESICFQHKSSTFSITNGIFSENQQLRLKAIEKLDENISKTGKFTENIEKILLIAAKSDRTPDFLCKVLHFFTKSDLFFSENPETSFDFLQLSFETLKNLPGTQKNIELCTKMANFANSLPEKVLTSPKTAPLLLVLASKTMSSGDLFSKVFERLAKVSENFPYDPKLVNLSLFSRFSTLKDTVLLKLIDQVLEIDAETAVAMLSSQKKLESSKKIEFLSKNRSKISNIDKKDLYSELLSSKMGNFQEKINVFGFILGDYDPSSVRFLSQLSESNGFISLLALQMSSPLENEIKTVKVLSYLLQRIHKKESDFQLPTEFLAQSLIIFLIDCFKLGPETRRLFLDLFEAIRKKDKKEMGLLDLNEVPGLFKENKVTYALKGYPVKSIRKVAKGLVRIKMILAQNANKINQFPQWDLLDEIILFLTQNLASFESNMSTFGLLTLIEKAGFKDFKPTKEFLHALEVKSKENEEFYGHYINIVMKFTDFNGKFEELVAISMTNSKWFDVFIENLTHLQSLNSFFSVLSEKNQNILLEMLLKAPNQEKSRVLLDLIKPDTCLLSDILSNLNIKLDFESIHSFFLLITRQNVTSIDLYRETQNFLTIFLTKGNKYPQKTLLLRLVFRVLRENIQQILENKSILFDFQGKRTPKEYQVHLEDLMGNFTPNKSYKNLETAIKVFKRHIGAQNDNLEEFSLVYEVLEYIASFTIVSFKTVSNRLEKLFTSMRSDTIEEIERLQEIIQFFVAKVVELCPKLSKKLGQFILISGRLAVKKAKLRKTFDEESFEKDMAKIMHIYGNENADMIVIVMMGLLSRSKIEDITRVLSLFSNFLTKSLPIESLFQVLSQFLCFLHLLQPSKRINSHNKSTPSNKNLVFLQRKLCRKSIKSPIASIFHIFLLFLDILVRSKQFAKLLSRSLRTFITFQQDLTSFFSEMLFLERFLFKSIKKASISKRKLIIFSKKKPLKRLSHLQSQLQDYLHGLLPLDVIFTIYAGTLSAYSSNLDFKAFILKGLRKRVLQNKENSKKVTLGAKQTLLKEVLKGLFEKGGRIKKNVSFLRVALMLASELLSEVVSSGEMEDIEINFDSISGVLEHEKKDIVGLGVLLLARLSDKRSKFLESVIQRLGIIMEKTLNLVENEKEGHIQEIGIATLRVLITNLDVILNPYLERIQKTLFKLKYNEILLLLAQTIPGKNLLKPFLILVEEFVEFDMGVVASFIQNVLSNLSAQDFQEVCAETHKALMRMLDVSRVVNIDPENEDIDWDSVKIEEEKVSEAYAEFAVKCNEVQLKKFMLQVVNWSEKKLDLETVGFGFPYYKKIVFYRVCLRLFDRLGPFFVGFFSYFFESSLSLLSELCSIYLQSSKTNNLLGKRPREIHDQYYILNWMLIELTVQTLIRLFKEDKEEFIDNQKYEKLVERIPGLFEVSAIDHWKGENSFSEFYEGILKDMVQTLIELMNDDYKWKSLHYNMLLKTRSEDKHTRLAVMTVIASLIETLKERYVVLISDLMPFLNELLDDREVEIEKVCKEIVGKLEKVSGENIREYLKKL